MSQAGTGIQNSHVALVAKSQDSQLEFSCVESMRKSQKYLERGKLALYNPIANSSNNCCGRTSHKGSVLPFSPFSYH